MVIGWIKNHILSSNNGRNRQLEDSEMKVKQSPQKHCNPDCYLNKRSKPQKILKIIPIEYRLPRWKNTTFRRNCTSNASSSDSIDISQHVKENVKEKTKKVASPITSHKSKLFCQQMLPETKNTRSSTKSSSPKEEILDVNIPMMKFPKKMSNTFPKMSPSRRIQNINLVLPPGPKIELSKDIEDMCEDTVLWLSIPRCTLPRNSSPLSTISISPSRYQSPGISPIKSPNEVEYLLQTNSGAIYKTSNALTKKLFHETVLDSGYSD